MAGLVRKKVTVRGKSGKTFQRSVMVRAGEAVKRTAGKVGRFVNKHKGKIAGAAALAGAAYLGLKHGSKIAGAARGVGAALNAQRHWDGDKKLTLRERARGVAQSAKLGAAMNADGDKGRLGRVAVREADNARMGKAREAAGRAAFRGAGAIDHATSAVRGAVGRAAFRTAGAIDSVARSRSAPAAAPAPTTSSKRKRK